MRPLLVNGVGLWAPGYPSPDAWFEARPDPAATEPPRGLLRDRIGRFTSTGTRVAVAVFEQAVARAGADAGSVAAVFGSAYGEIRIAFEQLDMIEAEGVTSPARFKNSVHNTAAGHTSIATGNTGFSTAIAAGRATVAMCLLEAWAWLEAHGGDVVVAVADEAPPPHLCSIRDFEPFGVAFHLGCEPTRATPLGRLTGGLRRGAFVSEAPVPIPDGLVANPAACGLPLVAALLSGTVGTVALELGESSWAVDVERPEPA